MNAVSHRTPDHVASQRCGRQRACEGARKRSSLISAIFPGRRGDVDIVNGAGRRLLEAPAVCGPRKDQRMQRLRLGKDGDEFDFNQ